MDEFKTGNNPAEPWEQPERRERQAPQDGYRPTYDYEGRMGGGQFQFQPRQKQKPRLFTAVLLILLVLSMVSNWIAIGVLRDEVATLSDKLRVLEDDDWYSGGEEDEDWSSGGGGFKEPTIPAAENVSNPQITLLPSRPNGTSLSSAEIYKQCIDSIVYIHISGGGGWEGSGVMMTRDGYIITNAHVVEGGRRADVTLHDGSKHEATLVGYDWSADLAVLKIEGDHFSAASFADSDGLITGQQVAAMGSPYSSALKGTITQGIISGLNRELRYHAGKLKFIQFDAAVSSGNSGGALIDEYGRVIGIVTMKYVVDLEYDSYVENISFAIPMTEAKATIESIFRFGSVRKRPNIGLTLSVLSDEQKDDWNLDSGLLVTAVATDGPAERAGVLVGDILLSADGETLYSISDLQILRDGKQYGDSMMFIAERDGMTEALELIFE